MKFHKSDSPDAADKTRVRSAGAEPPPAPAMQRSERGSTPAAASLAAAGQDWSNPQDWARTRSEPLQAGSIIKDRFVIEALIGRGGMGVVYRACDRRKEEAQDRDPCVAVKILGDEFRQHPDSLKALQREARKSQQLAHPNIITVFDFDRDGITVFMTMELLKGQPLDKVISLHPQGLPKEQVLNIAGQMAKGLAYAHEKYIVHSDFKPGNVFLEPDGSAKVLDFGIARAVPSRKFAAGDGTVFDAGQLGALTPSYASLEMLNGESPAPSDDVYALAVVIYELLTGVHPFDRKPANQAQQEALTPRPVKGLKRRQWKALARGLELERANRPADAAAFIRGVQGPTPVKKSIVAVITLLAVLSGVLAVGNLMRDEAGPDVPFAELPAATQEQFYSLLGQGDAELELELINSALFYYGEAYQLHARNPEAEKRLERVADLLIANAPQAGDEASLAVYLRDIDILLGNEHLRDYDGLIQQRRAVERRLTALSETPE